MTDSLTTPVTLTSIAERLGLTPGTVSSVLNGRARQRRISEATEHAVRELAAQLGYVPNDLARSLRRQSTGIIGVLFANHLQGWSQRVLDGLMPVFDAAGCMAFTAIHRWSPEREGQELRSLVKLRVDGVLAIPLPGGEAHYAELERRGVPLVFLADSLTTMPRAHVVAWDAAAAARLATRHLIETGCRRIGFLGARHETEMTYRRYEGYAATLREAGLAVRPEWTIWLGLEEDNARALEGELRRLLSASEPPDAFFVLNDNLALMALELTRRLGVAVPGQLSLVGMGNLAETAHPGVGLTTMREPCEELGREAAELILKLIAQPRLEPQRRLIISNELCPRATTRPSPLAVS